MHRFQFILLSHSMSARSLLLAAFMILSGAAAAVAQTAAACANAAVTNGTGGGTGGGYLPAGRNWKLAIDDEFDGPQLNTKIWKDWYTPGTIREKQRRYVPG